MAVSQPGKSVPATGGVRGYFTSTRRASVSTAVTLPLLLLYNIGLLMPGNKSMNAADMLTGLVMRFAGLKGFLIVNGILVCTSIVLLALLIKRGQFRPGHWLLLCLEGLILGLLMGRCVIYVMAEAHLLAVGGMDHPPFFQALTMSAGAGYWEELVFRLLMVGGPIAIARRGVTKQGGRGRLILTGLVAVVISSFLFSLAHYLGQESFDFYTFWYRTLSGLVFSSVFLLRGFAVAAYTHFLYDVVVMVF